MKDWRGNEYRDGELIVNGKKQLCEIKGCKNPAVRNCCKAEGDENRTHWHGAVHLKDLGLVYLCRECSDREQNQ